jgi:hypothetical protein
MVQNLYLSSEKMQGNITYLVKDLNRAEWRRSVQSQMSELIRGLQTRKQMYPMLHSMEKIKVVGRKDRWIGQ